MSYFLKSGTTFRVSSKEAMDLHETLPAGNYTVKKDPFDNLYLESIDSFEVKGKRYGDLDSNTDRILSTFLDRNAATGIMLTGEKGSGKSLLAKNLSVQAAKRWGIPTIVINQPWAGDKFNSFIQSIDQPCMVLFDEFEKVYDAETQEQMLTLLDGVFPSKKLFVLTCNDKWRVDSHMRNRPGRIFYMLDYKGLALEFITEYCEDNLKAKEHIEKICTISALFAQFNFDMLKALVEEMNRYNEPPEKALRMLNAKPEFDTGNKYNVELSISGVPVDADELDTKEWQGNPLQSTIRLAYKEHDMDVENPDWDWKNCTYDNTDIKKIDANSGKFVFVNGLGQALTLTKVKEKSFTYFDAM